MQFRHVYMNFRQNFSQKKNISPFQKKTLAETVNCIPKGLRKGNPFHGPFAQLSNTCFPICFEGHIPVPSIQHILLLDRMPQAKHLCTFAWSWSFQGQLPLTLHATSLVSSPYSWPTCRTAPIGLRCKNHTDRWLKSQCHQKRIGSRPPTWPWNTMNTAKMVPQGTSNLNWSISPH